MPSYFIRAEREKLLSNTLKEGAGRNQEGYLYIFPFSWLVPVNFGPIRTANKVVYLEKFSVITNTSTLQMRMVCRVLTNFVRS